MSQSPKLEAQPSGRATHDFFISGISGGSGFGKYESEVVVQVFNARNAAAARKTLRGWLDAIGATNVTIR